MKKKILFILMAMSLFIFGKDNVVNVESHIKNVTAITEVFGEGQKTTGVILEYDNQINRNTISTSTFAVDGRTITKVYVNKLAEKSGKSVDGKYVIIELSKDDVNASTLSQTKPNENGTANATQETMGPPATMPELKITPPKLNVIQIKDIKTINGKVYKSNTNVMVNNKVKNLIVDDFIKLEYKDPINGNILKYNLYVPKNYNKNKSYPLVLFIHDAGNVSNNPNVTLIQGLGAVSFASPSDQAKHESFVLAPQYEKATVNDNNETTNYLDTTVNLIKEIEKKYSIDENRLYTTGQSMGGMSSIALNIKYPDLFAASYLVACQWDSQLMSSMYNKNMWIVVSQGDLKAYPGMNASTEVFEKLGGKVDRAVWSGNSTKKEISTNAAKMIDTGANIKYVALEKGTVVPSGQDDNDGSNHTNTWRIAYTFEPIRDWLFTQVKK